MTPEQKQAYDWAKNQNYTSVAARYAKVLADMVDELNTQKESEPVIYAHWLLKDRKGNAVCSHCHRQDKVDPAATHCRYCGAQVVKE